MSFSSQLKTLICKHEIPHHQFQNQGVVSKTFKDSGVKKVLLHGLAAYPQESILML